VRDSGLFLSGTAASEGGVIPRPKITAHE